MENNANYQISVNGNAYAEVQKMLAAFSKITEMVTALRPELQATADEVEHQNRRSGSSLDTLQRKISSISMVSIIEQVQSVSTAIASISGPGIGFEQSMADLSSITGIVGKDLENLSKTARQTGAESGLGAQQAAQAFALLASQIQVDKIGMEGLKTLQSNTITLSHAAGMSMDDAATALAGTINQFGLEATEANRVINVLAAGSKYGAAEIVDLSQSFKVVGAASAAAGLSVEDTAGAIEVLSKNNLKGAEAGTALRNIMLKMQTVLGVDFRKTSMTDALDALKPKLSDATFLSKVFGMENIAAAQFLIKNAGAVAEMTAQVTNTNVAQEQAAIRTDTTQQMMARCQARIDDLKIGFFELTGSAGGYATIVAQQAVTVAQLLPLLALMGKGLMFVTSVQKMKAVWDGITSTTTTVMTTAQKAYNLSLYGCPIVWIVGVIGGLIAIIVLCATKVEGWGKQWTSVFNFAKNICKLYVESVKFYFTSMVNGIMISLDYIKIGWYKFKESVGLGDSNANKAAIDQINSDIESRKQAIVDGANKIKGLAVDTAKSLTWELSFKKSESASESILPDTPQTDEATATPAKKSKKPAIDFSLAGKGGKGGKGKTIDLNKIIPDVKGSTAYAAIASRLSGVKVPSLASAAASLAMPLTVAATSLPGTAIPGASPAAMATDAPRRSVSVAKFCDTIEIHIASADGKGYDQVRKEVTDVLTDMLEDYA